MLSGWRWIDMGENFKSTLFAIVVVLMVVLYVVITEPVAGEWNPVSEPPLESGEYLVIDRNDHYCFLNYDTGSGWSYTEDFDGDEDFRIGEMVAWQKVDAYRGGK